MTALETFTWRHRPAAITLACTAAGLCCACASIVHRPVAARAESHDTGIRYYEASPYLIAYSNGRGGVITEIRFLPNPARKMSARPHAVMADVATSLTFENGVLTTSASSGDATQLSKAVLAAASKLGTALITPALLPAAGAAEAVVPSPYIYRIVVKGDVVELVGGNRPEPFRLTLLSTRKKEIPR